MDIMKTIAAGKMRRTHIMYRANLAWNVLRDALRILEDQGILATENNDREVYISLTSQGHTVLQRFLEIERAFGEQLEQQTREAFVTNPTQ